MGRGLVGLVAETLIEDFEGRVTIDNLTDAVMAKEAFSSIPQILVLRNFAKTEIRKALRAIKDEEGRLVINIEKAAGREYVHITKGRLKALKEEIIEVADSYGLEADRRFNISRYLYKKAMQLTFPFMKREP